MAGYSWLLLSQQKQIWILLIFHTLTYGTRGERDQTTEIPTPLARHSQDARTKELQTRGLNNDTNVSPGQTTIGLMSLGERYNDSMNTSMNGNSENSTLRKMGLVNTGQFQEPPKSDFSGKTGNVIEIDPIFEDKQEVDKETGSHKKMSSEDERYIGKRLTTEVGTLPLLNDSHETMSEESLNISQKGESLLSIGLTTVVLGSELLSSDKRGSTAKRVSNWLIKEPRQANESFNKLGSRLSSFSRSQDPNHQLPEKPRSNDSSRGAISNEQIDKSPRRRGQGVTEGPGDQRQGRNSKLEEEKLIRGDLSNETWDLMDSAAGRQRGGGLLLSSKNASVIKSEGNRQIELLRLNRSDGNPMGEIVFNSSTRSYNVDSDSTNKTSSNYLHQLLLKDMPNMNTTNSPFQQDVFNSSLVEDILSQKSSDNSSAIEDNTNNGSSTVSVNTTTPPPPNQPLHHTYHVSSATIKLNHQKLKPYYSELPADKPLGTNYTSTSALQPHPLRSQNITLDLTSHPSSRGETFQLSQGHVTSNLTSYHYSPGGGNLNDSLEYLNDTQTEQSFKGVNKEDEIQWLRNNSESNYNETATQAINSDLERSTQSISSGILNATQSANYVKAIELNSTSDAYNADIFNVTIALSDKQPTLDYSGDYNMNTTLVHSEPQTTTISNSNFSTNTVFENSTEILNISGVISQVQSPDGDILHPVPSSTTESQNLQFLYYTYKDKLEELLHGKKNKVVNATDNMALTEAPPTSDDADYWNYTELWEEPDPLPGGDTANYNGDYYTQENDNFLTGDLDSAYDDIYEYYEDEDTDENINITSTQHEYNADLQWLHHMEDFEDHLVKSKVSESNQEPWLHGSGRYPSLEHSFLQENSLSLMVLYTWMAVLLIMLLISYIVFKHRQKISHFITDKKLMYRRRRSTPTEEGHQLLSANPYV